MKTANSQVDPVKSLFGVRGSWPVYDEEMTSAVVRVLESGNVNYWTGTEGRDFETEFASAWGVKHAIALANGSVALELALRAIGVGDGDEVVVTPRSFVASASAIVLCGATPVFADVDRDSQNVTADTIERVLSKRTKAILIVHHAGWPCDMRSIGELAKARRLRVVEDCAQAHGAEIDGVPVGSWGDIGAFSFCQDKIISTGGEGGMLITDNPAYWDFVWSYKDHGKKFDTVYRQNHSPGFRWLHESFGTNLRLTEMQAAIGRIQLRRLPDWVEQRRVNAESLLRALAGTPGLRLVRPATSFKHAYYRCYVFVKPEMLRKDWSRDRVLVAVNEAGLDCYSGTCPAIYREKAYEFADLGPMSRLPVVDEIGETSLAFDVHPALSAADMERAATVISKVMNEATVTSF